MKNNNALQAIKFTLFSASAGIIQIGSFTLLNEVVVPNLNIQNEALVKILSAEYGVCYLIALVLSVLCHLQPPLHLPLCGKCTHRNG